MCLAAGMDEDDFKTFSSKCSTGRAVCEGGPHQATPSVQPLWIQGGRGKAWGDAQDGNIQTLERGDIQKSGLLLNYFH